MKRKRERNRIMDYGLSFISNLAATLTVLINGLASFLNYFSLDFIVQSMPLWPIGPLGHFSRRNPNPFPTLNRILIPQAFFFLVIYARNPNLYHHHLIILLCLNLFLIYIYIYIYIFLIIS